MVFKTKDENLVAQHKYMNDPAKRAKHRARCLKNYYDNKEKLSAQRKIYYQRKKEERLAQTNTA